MNFLDKMLYAPFVVHMVVTRKCNLSCGYCNEYDKVSKPVEYKLLKKRVDKLIELKSFFITLTGGEPFLHPDIFKLIKYIRRHFIRVGLITNAYLLDESKIKKLNNSGLTDMQISIDGVKPNKTTVKVLNPLKKKLIMISKYAKFNINLNTVVGATDPKEILQVVNFAKKNNFYSTVQVIHDGNGQIKLSKEELKIYRIAKKRSNPPLWDRFFMNHVNQMIKTGEVDFKCRSGSRYLYVDEHGIVNWCSQTRHLFKKSLMEYSIDDLKEQFYLKKGCEPKCTIGCVRRASAFDSLRRYGN